MSTHETIRLEKMADGSTDVVAYFAPNFETTPIVQNDLFAADRPRGRGTIVRDNQMYRYELTVQGSFEDSRNLPPAHEQALLALDQDWADKGYVTPRMQVNRVLYYLFEVGGPFEFYDGNDEYTKYSMGEVDWSAGLFPTVQVEEFMPSRQAGRPRWEYTLKVVVGTDPSKTATGNDEEGSEDWWPFW